MKMNISIECTPDEARAFFGLPDVKPIQEEMLAKVRERLASAESALDPETFVRTWMNAGISGFESMQKTLLDAMASAARGSDR